MSRVAQSRYHTGLRCGPATGSPLRGSGRHSALYLGHRIFGARKAGDLSESRLELGFDDELSAGFPVPTSGAGRQVKVDHVTVRQGDAA